MAQQHPAGSRTRDRTRRWTAADVPDQSGRVAVITGANRGIGYQIARVLAARGAQVVLACRDTVGAQQAAAGIAASSPRAPAASVVQLDLSSLTSVRDAAAQIRARYPRLDLLINNAGVMEVPYQQTKDGFELTFAANHLGHFALNGLLLDSLLAAPGSRIVTMSSQAHTYGVMNFADLQAARGYDRSAAYGQSKLANLLFSYELDRRLTAAGARTAALAAHPGVVYTALFKHCGWPLRLLISPPARDRTAVTTPATRSRLPRPRPHTTR
jgi:NAD(P)-dependent dehydrogenase (short-subunit alcohol dehydrogenase family)